MKRCSDCKVEKPPADFHRNCYKPDGLSSECKECKKTYRRTRYRDNPEFRAKVLKNTSASARRRKEQDPDGVREKDRVKQADRRKRGLCLTTELRKYGITEEDYHRLLEKQGGACAICRKTCPVSSRLGVDHDHETNQVRGLLCKKCNLGIAYFDKNRDWLAEAQRYLETT